MFADLEYADDCIPDIAVILGVRLLPFKVGHKLLLERVRSPFAVGGPVNIEQLLEAVWICSHTYADGARGLVSGSSWRVKLWSWLTAMRSERDKTLVRTHARALEAYIEKSNRRPRNIRIQQNAPRTDGPFVPLFLEDLCGAYNYTPEQVFELPLRRAIFERFQIVIKPNSGLEWRPAWMGPPPERKEERSHVE